MSCSCCADTGQVCSNNLWMPWVAYLRMKMTIFYVFPSLIDVWSVECQCKEADHA